MALHTDHACAVGRPFHFARHATLTTGLPDDELHRSLYSHRAADRAKHHWPACSKMPASSAPKPEVDILQVHDPWAAFRPRVEAETAAAEQSGRPIAASAAAVKVGDKLPCSSSATATAEGSGRPIAASAAAEQVGDTLSCSSSASSSAACAKVAGRSALSALPPSSCLSGSTSSGSASPAVGGSLAGSGTAAHISPVGWIIIAPVFAENDLQLAVGQASAQILRGLQLSGESLSAEPVGSLAESFSDSQSEKSEVRLGREVERENARRREVMQCGAQQSPLEVLHSAPGNGCLDGGMAFEAVGETCFEDMANTVGQIVTVQSVAAMAAVAGLVDEAEVSNRESLSAWTCETAILRNIGSMRRARPVVHSVQFLGFEVIEVIGDKRPRRPKRRTSSRSWADQTEEALTGMVGESGISDYSQLAGALSDEPDRSIDKPMGEESDSKEFNEKPEPGGEHTEEAAVVVVFESGVQEALKTAGALSNVLHKGDGRQGGELHVPIGALHTDTALDLDSVHPGDHEELLPEVAAWLVELVDYLQEQVDACYRSSAAQGLHLRPRILVGRPGPEAAVSCSAVMAPATGRPKPNKKEEKQALLEASAERAQGSIEAMFRTAVSVQLRERPAFLCGWPGRTKVPK